jgi:hypothetical protein
MTNKAGLVWRIVLVVAMGLTTVMTLLGAVGTACLAWSGNLYGAAFKWIVPYMPTYQMLVYVSLIAGVAMTLVCYAIVRGDKWFYLGALVTLIVGGGAAAVQMFYTSSLKQISFFATPPTNIRFYITAATLIVFVIVRFPGIWKHVTSANPSRRGNLGAPTGLALIVSGLALLTTPLWAGPSHMVEDYNLVLTLQIPIVVDGLALIVVGVGLLFTRRLIALARTRRAALGNQ